MAEVKDKLVTAESLKSAYDANKTAINKKVDIEQGVENYGKVFTVNSEGNADIASFPAQTDVVYDETKGRLVVTEKTNLPGNISVDPLLLNEGDAADAKVVGDKISELKSELNELRALIKKLHGGQIPEIISIKYNGTVAKVSGLASTAINYVGKTARIGG